MKRILACLLAVALCFGVMPAPLALAKGTKDVYSNQIVGHGGGIPPTGEWTEREGGLGAVRVSKAITPADDENENYFDITLTAQAKQIELDKSISVVIVMDVSNTMNAVDEAVSSQSRVVNAKAAANQFIKQFCEHPDLDTNRQIGVVAFNTNARWEIPLESGNANSASDVDALQARVDGISVSPDANADPEHVRFTNIEGGLKLAHEQLKNDDAVNKFVIMLTDGFPTTYVESYDASSKTIMGYDTYTPDATESKEGHFYDEVAGIPVGYGTNYSDRAALKAQMEAEAMKDAGINVFSVGISVGQQTIKSYVDAITPDVSTVDRETESYVIGSATDPDAYRTWLGTSIGGGPDLSGDDHMSYSDGDNAQELEFAYDSFLKEIVQAQKSPLTSFRTEDPMGDDIEFLHFYDKDGNPASLLNGESSKGAENTASYDASTKTISWDKLKSGFVLTTEKVGNETTNVYTYTLKYRVRLTNEAADFAPDATYLTNNDAKLKFASEVVPEEGTVNYPDPSVKGYKGNFSFIKMSDNATPEHEDDTPLKGAEFVLAHSDTCSVCAAEKEKGSIFKNVDVPAMTVVSDENGLVSFDGIPSGHDYVLSESATAPDHELNPSTSTVTVSYGKTDVQIGELGDESVLLVEGIHPQTGESIVVTHNHRLEPAYTKGDTTPEPIVDNPVVGETKESRFARTGDPVNPFAVVGIAAAAAAAGGIAYKRRKA